MRALVLGGTGFIGSRVVEYLVLQKGIEVRVPVRDFRKAVRVGRLPVELRRYDSGDGGSAREIAHGCDAVVCCVHPFSSSNEKAEALAACRWAVVATEATSTRRVVYLSSAAVYGARGGVVSEASRPRPDTSYGAIKLLCEKVFLKAHRQHRIRAVVLRFGIVYGPFGWSWSERPVRQMLSGRLVIPENAAGACNAAFVDDVARMAGEAAVADVADGSVLNVNPLARTDWKSFYASYERAVRPGALCAVSLKEIEQAIAQRERERRTGNMLRRAIEDRTVRARLNDIPLVSRLNHVVKSLGWKGLPPAGNHRNGSASVELHLPDRDLLGLYTSAPFVDGSKAAGLFGFEPRGISAGMERTVAWLRWAGLVCDMAGSSRDRIEG